MPPGARLAGLAPRRFTVPTDLPAGEVRRRVDVRAVPFGTGFALLGRGTAGDGSTYYVARSADAVEDIRPRERFALDAAGDGLAVTGRPSPRFAGFLLAGYAICLLAAVAAVATGTGRPTGDTVAFAALALLAAAGLRIGVAHRLRAGDARRMRRWLESVLTGDD